MDGYRPWCRWAFFSARALVLKHLYRIQKRQLFAIPPHEIRKKARNEARVAFLEPPVNGESQILCILAVSSKT